MATNKIDGKKLRQAISEYGSLSSALQNLRSEVQSLTKELANRKAQLKSLGTDLISRQKRLKSLDEEINKGRAFLDQMVDAINRRSTQYALFERLLAMLTTSPSRDKTPDELINWIFTLKYNGFLSINSAEELRNEFVRIVMGTYLHSYRCTLCGRRFFMDGDPSIYHKMVSCPSCSTIGVTADDTFLRLLTGEEASVHLPASSIEKPNEE